MDFSMSCLQLRDMMDFLGILGLKIPLLMDIQFLYDSNRFHQKWDFKI